MDSNFLHRLESAGPDEFASLLRTGDQAALLAYLGAQLAPLQGLAQSMATPTRGDADAKRGNVIILHGILGAHLADGDEDGTTIWLNPISLLEGKFARLAMPAQVKITPTGLLKRYYGTQMLTLAQRWNVQAFAFDWRQDLDTCAQALSAAVDRWFPNWPQQPVHIVAHSMGGLVARAYLGLRPEHRGRLVMLGTPNRGSYGVTQLLHGRNVLLTPLALLDLQHTREEVLAVIKTWPGVHAMDPNNLALAKLPVDPERMVYIAGSNRNTAIAIRDTGRLGEEAGYEWSGAGDGKVPHVLGLLDGVPTYYCDEEHGALPNNAQVLAAVDEILDTGTTHQLSRRPIAGRGDGKAMEPSREMAGFLSAPGAAGQDEIEPAGNHADPAVPNASSDEAQPAPPPPLTPAAPPSTIAPTVVNGELASAQDADAIVLGHYEGVEPLLARERPVLHELNSVLPSRLGHPFFIPGEGAPALLVVGLGSVGQLDEAALRQFVQRVIWAASQFGVAKLATTLIGAGAGNLAMEQAAAAWREALRTTAIQVIFYERDATRSAAIANAFAQPLTAATAGSTAFEPTAVPARLSIERSPRGYRVALMTQTASIPERESQVDPELIEEINAKLAEDDEAASWAATMRRLLLPPELARAAERPGPVVVACDRPSARILWEHLHPEVSRQFRSFQAPLRSERRVLRKVLIVADTCAEAHLPGTVDEAAAIQKALTEHAVTVMALVGPAEASRATVMRELLLGGYDAVHFAGHCCYDEQDPAASGWVFSGGQVLSARELARLDRAPGFVFSNACESGRVAGAGAVPSFAEVMLGLGVEHLIATARPVPDDAARDFATALWSAADRQLYEALASARKAAGASAASWQHYGDPAARLICG